MIDCDHDHTTLDGDVHKYWDALPSGGSCPTSTTGNCGNPTGHLAMAEVANDASHPLRTFYGYLSTGETNYESVCIGGTAYTTRYTYDSSGRLTRRSFLAAPAISPETIAALRRTAERQRLAAQFPLDLTWSLP